MSGSMRPVHLLRAQKTAKRSFYGSGGGGGLACRTLLVTGESYLTGLLVPEDGGNRISGDLTSQNDPSADRHHLVLRRHQERRLRCTASTSSSSSSSSGAPKTSQPRPDLGRFNWLAEQGPHIPKSIFLVPEI